MLVFYFGAMESGKSAYALMTVHQRNRPDAASHPHTALLATTLDRTDESVTSRTGMQMPALRLVPGEVRLAQFAGADTVVIDEAQFLTPEDVDVLGDLSDSGREVICFGLRSDFLGRLFPGSLRLFELADTVRQVALEPTCASCDRQAVVNARIVDGALTTAGPRIALDVIDSEEDGPVSYRPMCLRCWKAAQQGGPTTDIG